MKAALELHGAAGGEGDEVPRGHLPTSWAFSGRDGLGV